MVPGNSYNYKVAKIYISKWLQKEKWNELLFMSGGHYTLPVCCTVWVNRGKWTLLYGCGGPDIKDLAHTFAEAYGASTFQNSILIQSIENLNPINFNLNWFLTRQKCELTTVSISVICICYRQSM